MSVNSNTLRPAVPLLVIRIIKKTPHFWEIYCTAASYTHFLHVHCTKKTSWLHFAHHHRNNIAVVLRSSRVQPRPNFLMEAEHLSQEGPYIPNTTHIQLLLAAVSISEWAKKHFILRLLFFRLHLTCQKCSSIKPTPHYAFTGFQETHKSPPTRKLVRLYNPNQCLRRKLELRRWMMCVWGPRVQTYQ